MTKPNPKNAESTATGAVFDALLSDIARGTHAPGERLPSERDLATQLGASRPTVREALRRLSEWGLVKARRGSGIVVQAKRDWSLEALPAYLRFGKPGPDEPGIGQMIRDLLVLRTKLLTDLARTIAPRLDAANIQGARDALESAWANRTGPDFHNHDFEIFRRLAEGAGFLPALWLLNRVCSVYIDIATPMAQMGPPDDYLESYHRFFAALQRRDGEEAGRVLEEYFDRHDARLLAAIAHIP
jgi:DNA-binding FadR family transcriptional regulator